MLGSHHGAPWRGEPPPFPFVAVPPPRVSATPPTSPVWDPAERARAREELMRRHAHLVKYVVGRLGVSIPGVFDHEDAMQAGAIGLLQAIDAYRPVSGATFESYAIVRIRGAILDAIRALDGVGRATRETARAIERGIRALEGELGRTPVEAEVAARLGLSLERYRECLRMAAAVTVSLDELEPRSEDPTEAVPGESLVDPEGIDPLAAAERQSEIEELKGTITKLSERQQLVLSLYYQEGLTFKEIGRVLGVTESRVCQIHTETILALRSRLLDPATAARLRKRRTRR